MNLECYPFIISNENYSYEFFSEGPNGKIKKIIKFDIIDIGQNVFNLAFGDWIENNLNDLVANNNNDREKVLATVAATVFEFTTLNPKAIIYAKGSTSSRTRLYQMGISTFFDEINDLFVIQGFNSNEWELFKKSINYTAFLVIRRK